MCLWFPLLAFSQLVPFNIDSFPIKKNAAEYFKYPCAGGLNTVQVNNFDLNHDGIEDLILFDRVGNVLLTFLNNGTISDNPYIYAPEYQQYFPKIMYWMRIYDYNCDGKKDIFTATSSTISTIADGVRVFRNTSIGSNIDFTLAKDLLVYDDAGVSTKIFIKNVDLPDFYDADGDNDLDLFTFDESGSFLQFYKNFSQENGYNCDSLIFDLTDNCWGEFLEASLSNYCSLDVSCRMSSNREQDAGHPGSTTLVFDYEGNGTPDLLLGDLSAINMNLLLNDGTIAAPHMVSQDTMFPDYSTPIKCYAFPAAFRIDVNNDNLYDLLISPSNEINNNNIKSLQWYKNTGTNTAPYFERATETFLQSELLDLGEGAYPAMVDVTGDGKNDLVVGNFSIYLPPGSSGQARLALLTRGDVGSEAYFQLQDMDWLNTSGLPISTDYYKSFTPTFGDLDGDGDSDMLMGESNGKLLYYENTAPIGSAPNYTLISVNYQSIDPGQSSAPQLVDVDRDNLLDLLIGERNGNVNYYRNTGSLTSPIFTLITDAFGDIDVREAGMVSGYSMPHLFTVDTVNQKYALLLGSESGILHYYTNIDGNLSGVFDEDFITYKDVLVGKRTAPYVGNIDNDSANELIVGNYRGGVNFFEYDTPSSVTDHVVTAPDVVIYPNPADESFIIDWKEKSDYSITVFDIYGKPIFQSTSNHFSHKIDSAPWSSGIYLVQVKTDTEMISKKIVVK